jgi:hypothetical protein
VARPPSTPSIWPITHACAGSRSHANAAAANLFAERVASAGEWGEPPRCEGGAAGPRAPVSPKTAVGFYCEAGFRRAGGRTRGLGRCAVRSRVRLAPSPLRAPAIIGVSGLSSRTQPRFSGSGGAPLQQPHVQEIFLPARGELLRMRSSRPRRGTEMPATGSSRRRSHASSNPRPETEVKRSMRRGGARSGTPFPGFAGRPR